MNRYLVAANFNNIPVNKFSQSNKFTIKENTIPTIQIFNNETTEIINELNVYLYQQA